MFSRKISPLICIVVGFSVLLSWLLNWAPVSSPLTAVAMNPLTATEFILCGVALLVPGRWRSVLGGVIAGLALAKLVSFLGYDLRVDRLLFAEGLEHGIRPNRMAPHTALNFFFAGLAFAFFDRSFKHRYMLRDFLVIPVILVALTGAVGYLYTSTGLTQVGNFIPIAFNTTVTFIVLGFSVMLWNHHDGLFGVFFRANPSAVVGLKLLPYVLLFPVVLGWIRIQGEHRGLMTAEYGVAVMAIAWAVGGTVILWILVNKLNGLEETLEVTLKKEAEGKLSRLKKFFPPSIAAMIASGEIEDPFRWRRSDITIIFIDIRGFTPFSERGEPEEVMQMLQTYYSTVARIAQKHHGTIGSVAGDGVMIFFNEPVNVENPQLKAVQMALEIRRELAEIWSRYSMEDLELDFGAGIASGYNTIGGIGAEGFWDYTVIGTATNVASRLCSVAKEGQILVSRRFLSSVDINVDTERVGELELKGLHRPVEAFNIRGIREAEAGA